MKKLIIFAFFFSNMAFAEEQTGFPINITANEEKIVFELDCKPASSRLDLLEKIDSQINDLSTSLEENFCHLMNLLERTHKPCDGNSMHKVDSCVSGATFKEFLLDNNPKNYALINALNMAYNTGKEVKIEFIEKEFEMRTLHYVKKIGIHE